MERKIKTLFWAAGFALLATVLLSVCASPTTPSTMFTFPGRSQAEVVVLSADAERMFTQVAVCADAPGARPEGVRVRLYLPGTPWNCPPNTGGCMRSMQEMEVLDWRAGAGYSESFGHESVHLARYLVSGNADVNHTGPWWVGGRACQAGLQ